MNRVNINFDHTPLSIVSVTLSCHFDSAIGPTSYGALSKVLRGKDDNLRSSSNINIELGSENYKRKKNKKYIIEKKQELCIYNVNQILVKTEKHEIVTTTNIQIHVLVYTCI